MLTVGASESRLTDAVVAVHLIVAGSSILTRIAGAVINVDIAFGASPPGLTDTLVPVYGVFSIGSSEPRASPEELVHTHPADTRVILAQVNLGLTPLSRESGGAGTLIVIHLKAKGLAAKVSCGLLFLCDCSIGMPCLGNLTECVLRETKGEGRNRVKGRLWLTRSVQLPPRRQGCSRQSSMFSSQCLHGKWLVRSAGMSFRQLTFLSILVGTCRCTCPVPGSCTPLRCCRGFPSRCKDPPSHRSCLPCNHHGRGTQSCWVLEGPCTLPCQDRRLPCSLISRPGIEVR